MLFYLVVDQTAANTNVSGWYNIFFYVYTHKIFYVKKTFFFTFKALYVLKTHFDCFNTQANNLDDVI